MSSPSANVVAPEVWRELLSLSCEEAYERTLLGRLLSLWRERWEVEGVAAYLRRDDHFRLVETSRGPDATRQGPSFPDGFDTSPPPGVSSLELPAGLLLYSGAPEIAAVSAADPLTLLLAGELRAAHLKRALKDQSFQVNYRGVELEALYDVGLAIASTLDLEQLSEEILLRAVSLLDARRGALYRREKDRYVLNRTFGGDARAHFEPEATPQDRRRMRVPEDLLPGALHLLAFPIEIEGDPRGVLAVGDKESRRGVGPFSEKDRRTLSLFANQAAIALENARLHHQALEKERLEREMELAAEIQRQILPHGSPEVKGFEIEGWSRPARQVGGDYYDLLPLPDGRLRLAVGDVSGKGVPAALLVSTLHSSLRLLLGTATLEPRLLERLNRHVHESSAANKFITVVVVEAETASGRLTWVNAGHNPGLLLRRGGAVEPLESSGFPVGMLPQATYHMGETRLEPGDLVCLYSDGITEAASTSGEEFGVERLVTFLEEHRELPLAELRRGIDRSLEVFTQGEPQADDETLVLLRRRPN